MKKHIVVHLLVLVTSILYEDSYPNGIKNTVKELGAENPKSEIKGKTNENEK